MTTTLPEKIALGIISTILVVGLALSWLAPEFFLNHYVKEDGGIEWLTVVVLLTASLAFITRFFLLRKERTLLFLFVTLMAAFVFFFGAGEEISWGQRIFGFETPEALGEYNRQGETTVHNLEFGGVSINKLIFSKGLAVGLVSYLLIIPFFYRKNENFRAFIDRAGIPLAKTPHVILWLVVVFVVEVIMNHKIPSELWHAPEAAELSPGKTVDKSGEVMECCGAFLCCLTVLFPFNPHIYDRRK